MAEDKKPLQWIEDDSERNAVLAKRREAIFKKARELAAVSGAEIGIAISNPDKGDFTVWPSFSDVKTMFEKFMSLSHIARIEKSWTLEEYLSFLIRKETAKLGIAKRDNDEREIQEMLNQAYEGKDLNEFSIEKLKSLALFADKKSKLIAKRDRSWACNIEIQPFELPPIENLKISDDGDEEAPVTKASEKIDYDENLKISDEGDEETPVAKASEDIDYDENLKILDEGDKEAPVAKAAEDIDYDENLKISDGGDEEAPVAKASEDVDYDENLKISDEGDEAAPVARASKDIDYDENLKILDEGAPVARASEDIDYDENLKILDEGAPVARASEDIDYDENMKILDEGAPVAKASEDIDYDENLKISDEGDEEAPVAKASEDIDYDEWFKELMATDEEIDGLTSKVNELAASTSGAKDEEELKI